MGGAHREAQIVSGPAPAALGTARRALRAALLLNGVAVLVFATVADGFATAGNLLNLVQSALPLLLLATGQTLVLISAGIDLSAAAVVGLASVAGGLVMSGDIGWLAGSALGPPAAAVTMGLTGVAVGVVNGVAVTWLRMPAFMVTLTTGMFAGGLAVWGVRALAGTETVYGLPPGFTIVGASTLIGVIWAGVGVLLAHVALERTLIGRWLRAVGFNANAARVSGVPVSGVIVAAYAASGLFAAAAAVLLTGRLETASPTHGRALLLDVLGAAVIGGTSLSGGRGSVGMTMLGVLFLAIVGNGLTLLNLSEFTIAIVKGSLILLAALLDVARAHLEARP